MTITVRINGGFILHAAICKSRHAEAVRVAIIRHLSKRSLEIGRWDGALELTVTTVGLLVATFPPEEPKGGSSDQTNPSQNTYDDASDRTTA